MNHKEIADFFKGSKSDGENGTLDTMEVLRELTTIMTLTSTLTGNKKIAKAVSAVSVATSLGTVARHMYGALKKHTASTAFTIKIAETDEVFVIAEKWLNDALPTHQQRSVFINTHMTKDLGYDDEAVPDGHSSSRPSSVTLKLHMDGSIAQNAEIAGHTITLSTNNPGSSADEKKKKAFYEVRSIVITCPSLEARDAVLEELRKEAQKLAYRPPTFNTSMGWGGFHLISEAPGRSIESVLLKEGQMDRIVGHMKQFLDNENAYAALGIPYRTGIMLHGNPGSGKSSTASAIANELGLNIYYISLSGLDDDDALSRAFNSIPARSLTILEDVDVYRAAQTRKEDVSASDKGITLAGLLNCLDGLTAAHGVITVMTTNHLDKLDPALIRPGRVDLTEEINELDSYQLETMCQYFLGFVPEGLPEITPENGITSAQIVNIIRKYIPEVDKSADDIVRFVKSKALSFTK